MTAFTLSRPLSVELTDLIGRLHMLATTDDCIAGDELRDLIGFMQAVRALHHKEVREARMEGAAMGSNYTAKTLEFACERLFKKPQHEGVGDAPSDTNPKGAA